MKDARLVYAVFSHTQPNQVLRLVRTIRALSPLANVVVHHDPGHAALDSRAVESLGGMVVPEAIAGEWGDFSLVQQHLHTMQWCATHLDLDWFTVLTGQSYPIKPLSEFEAFLGRSDADAFMLHFDAFDPGVWPIGEAEKRYCYRYYKLPRFRYWHRLPRIHAQMPHWIDAFNRSQSLIQLFGFPRGLPTRIGLRARNRPFGHDGCTLNGANLNYNLSRKALDRILDFTRMNPSYAHYFARTVIPDEVFFSTILCNSNDLRVENDNLRLIHWPEGHAASGAVMDGTHWDDIMASTAFFGLKFDHTVSPEVLDRLDAWLGLEGTGDQR